MTTKKGQPRPIGQAVIHAVEELERKGEACYSAGRPPKKEMRQIMPRSPLRRAVKYGLVTRSEQKPYVYRAADNWREALEAPQEGPKFKSIGRPVASVWDLAAV